MNCYLCDEDGSDSLIESCSVHVDSGSDGEDESGDQGVDSVLDLETVDGDGEGGGGGRRPEGGGQRVGHVANELERELAGNQAWKEINR